MEPVLQIKHLSKSFGSRKILHDISFDALGGEVLGFLGPNGAGKTTTIKIVAGLLRLEEGEVTVCGHDLNKDFEKAMAEIGGIVENPEFYGYLSGWENLRQYAAMREGITNERIAEVVRMVGLENRIHDRVSKYSLGMRQRLGVAQAMMHRPHLLILDEPTNGLDPAAIKALRDILKHLAHEEGVAVLVSSHLMSEMELMCDRVAIIVGGKLRSVDTVEELVAASTADREEYMLRVNDPDAAMVILSAMETVQPTLTEEGIIDLSIPTEGAMETLAAANRALVMGNISLYTVSQKENRRLEDVFIELTEKGGDQIG